MIKLFWLALISLSINFANHPDWINIVGIYQYKSPQDCHYDYSTWSIQKLSLMTDSTYTLETSFYDSRRAKGEVIEYYKDFGIWGTNDTLIGLVSTRFGNGEIQTLKIAEAGLIWDNKLFEKRKN